METRINKIPAIQEIKIAAYHHKGPSKKPIRAEYQTSARPSLFFERKKASKKITKPRNKPERELNNEKLAKRNNLSKRKNKKAIIKALRGISPFFISMTEIAIEKIANNDVNNKRANIGK